MIRLGGRPLARIAAAALSMLVAACVGCEAELRRRKRRAAR